MSFPDKMTLHRRLGKKESLSKCAVVTFHLSSLFTVASVQKSVDTCKQLDNLSSILMDCARQLNDTQKRRKEIAKLTQLSLDAGLKTLAPSHSCATALKGDNKQGRKQTQLGRRDNS
jgi:hypothetical protein